MPKYIKVLHEIEVPEGKFCWDYSGVSHICPHFDNEGGHSTCTIFKYEDIKKTEDGELKPDVCLNLPVKE